ncbi:MAG: T9SS type A sorting domain-containing protein [Vicingaceae bacterium]
MVSKKIVLLHVFFTFLMSDIWAQHTYIPFPDSSAFWIIKEYDENYNFEYGYQWQIIGDTSINSNTYWIVGQYLDTNELDKWPPFWYGIRNDTINKNVVIYDPTNSSVHLLYDFSLKVGDTIPTLHTFTDAYSGKVITLIDSTLVESTYHYVFEVDNNQLSPYVEGIGGLNGVFERPYFFEGGTELICLKLGTERKSYFVKDGEMCNLQHIYSGVKNHPSEHIGIEIYPNPVNNESVISVDNDRYEIKNVQIIGTDGKSIIRSDVNASSFSIGSFSLRPGIYQAVITMGNGIIRTKKFIKSNLYD